MLWALEVDPYLQRQPSFSITSGLSESMEYRKKSLFAGREAWKTGLCSAIHENGMEDRLCRTCVLRTQLVSGPASEA
jgi:hypothetical protein